MLKVSTKKHQNDVIEMVLLFLLLTLNIFYTFFCVSVVVFEQINVSWAVFDSSILQCWISNSPKVFWKLIVENVVKTIAGK